MPDPSDAFKEMAERIGNIALAEFAGAVVIVPPGEHEPIVFLTTDPKPSAAQLYAAVQSRVEIGAAQAQDAEAKAHSWQRR